MHTLGPADLRFPSILSADIWAGISVAVLLLIASFGCYAFIRAGVYNAAMDKLLEEGDYTRENKRKSPVFGAISTAYWLVVTALFSTSALVRAATVSPGTLWYIWGRRRRSVRRDRCI